MALSRLWSLYLGRPTTLKTADISPSCLSFDFDRLLSCRSIAHEKKVGTRVYESLLQLMELASPLCDNHLPSSSDTTESYFKMAATYQSLKRWYAALPSDLRWPPQTQEKLPASYFLIQ